MIVCTDPETLKRIFSEWDCIEKTVQQELMNEYRLKNNGCYTKKTLFKFLRNKLGIEKPVAEHVIIS